MQHKIASIHQSESGWTVISTKPEVIDDVLHAPQKCFIPTELLDGITLEVGMSIKL